MITSLIQFREHIDCMRDAANRASDHRLSEQDRGKAAKMAKVYDVILSEHSAAFLNEFDHSSATVH